MFSLTKGRPVAKIQGGEDDGQIIYIQEGDDSKRCCAKCESVCGGECMKGRGGCKKCCKGKGGNDTKERKLPIKKNDPLYLFKDELNNMMNSVRKEIKIDEDDSGMIIPLVNPSRRETLFISGPEGAGKSTYAGEYIKQYKKLFPKNKVFLFSKLDEDPALDKYKPVRIVLNEELIEDPITPKELNNSLVIFDDIGTISNKEVASAVKHLRDEILEVGRHDNIYIISTTHNLTDNKETKASLMESNAVTFFPSGGDTYHIKSFLTRYCGLNRYQIDKIFKLPSRWVTIYKRFPMYILYSKGIYLTSEV